MSEPFIAEIRIFAGNFAIRNWAFCDGQLLPIAQNTALFSIIGTVYGGDGRTTTALPNLQGRAPMGSRRGPGLSPRSLGQRIGVETVTLTELQMPNHNHNLRGSNDEAEFDGSNDPSNKVTGVVEGGAETYSASGNLQPFPTETVVSQGGGQAHTNIQPYLTLNYIIALTGVYPSRS
jgi:microcystin-dependent protein